MRKWKPRKPRPVVFVCISISPSHQLISEVIQTPSQEEASKRFSEQHHIPAQIIHGPFRYKRKQVLDCTRTLKFANQQKRARYNGWEVNAVFLKEPENHAFLLFLHTTDKNSKQHKPTGTIIAPISDLEFLYNEQNDAQQNQENPFIRETKPSSTNGEGD